MSDVTMKVEYSELAKTLANYPPPSKRTAAEWEALLVEDAKSRIEAMQVQHVKAGVAKGVLDTLKNCSMGFALITYAVHLLCIKSFFLGSVLVVGGLMIVFAALFVGVDGFDSVLEVGESTSRRSAWLYAFGCVTLCAAGFGGAVYAIIHGVI